MLSRLERQGRQNREEAHRHRNTFGKNESDMVELRGNRPKMNLLVYHSLPPVQRNAVITTCSPPTANRCPVRAPQRSALGPYVPRQSCSQEHRCVVHAPEHASEAAAVKVDRL